MIGRRVESFDAIEKAGDYYLGDGEVEGEPRRLVWFLLPIHEGATKFDRPGPGSGIHTVSEPPWTFRECPDGSVEIRDSIACGGRGLGPQYWHGFLDEGHVWRTL